jgi:WD40 repeat protein
MDELRIVSKKANVKIRDTALIKSEPVPVNVFNPRIFECKLFKTLHEHQGDVLSLAVAGDKIFSGSQDKTIKIWDLNSGKRLKTLTGHNSGIYSLAVSEGKLLSASADRTIKIWDINNGNLVCTLLGHNNHVYSLSAANRIFASASLDKTIKIWDIETKKILKVIPAGETSALSICLFGSKIASGHSDGTLKIWEISSGRLLAGYRENTESINSVCFNNGLLISGSRDKTIKIWDSDSLELLQTLYGHKSSVWAVTVDSGRIISASDDKTVKIWNLDDGSLVNTLKGHRDWVSSVAAGAGRIISGSGDYTINTWSKIPVHNCNTIDLLIPELEKSPFDTNSDFDKKKKNNILLFYKKLADYDYIKVGNAELLADQYSFESNNFPLKINLTCDKVSRFLNLPKSSISSIKIGPRDAEQIYANSGLYDLYLRFYLSATDLKHELSIASGNRKFVIEQFLVNLTGSEPKKGTVKKDRLKISRGNDKPPSEILGDPPRHDCNTIDTTDSFRSPFEDPLHFEKRVRTKLMNYGHINIGKVELLAEQYSITAETFPLKVIITCDKVLNISDLDREFPGKILVGRNIAQELYEKSKVLNLFINFYEKDTQFYYDLSLIFKDLQYFIV